MPTGIIFGDDELGLTDNVSFRITLGAIGDDYLSSNNAISAKIGYIFGDDELGLTDNVSFRITLGIAPYSFPKPAKTNKQKQEWYN